MMTDPILTPLPESPGATRSFQFNHSEFSGGALSESEYTTCPVCGHEFALQYEPVEAQVLRAVTKFARHNGVASSQAVALEVSLSKSQAVRWLNKLEKKGSVQRVGVRMGWRIAA